jgi:hypothetical protein
MVRIMVTVAMTNGRRATTTAADDPGHDRHPTINEEHTTREHP